MIEFGSNKAVSIKNHYINILSGLYGKDEAAALTSLAFEHILGWKKHEQLIRQEEQLNESVIVDFIHFLKRLKKYEPIQYIIGQTTFRGLTIKVSPAVLIPRPETEELVEYAGKLLQKRTVPVAVDFCTGSGCIAIALKKEEIADKVYGIDISEEALTLARKNAIVNDAEIIFQKADLLNDAIEIPGKIDLIISNPPYVRASEKTEIHANVLQHEPHIALFVPDADPLVFYKKIADLASEKLISGGILAVEINTALSAETAACFAEKGFQNIQVIRDINSLPRIISAVKM